MYRLEASFLSSPSSPSSLTRIALIETEGFVVEKRACGVYTQSTVGVTTCSLEPTGKGCGDYVGVITLSTLDVSSGVLQFVNKQVKP